MVFHMLDISYRAYHIFLAVFNHSIKTDLCSWISDTAHMRV